MIDKIRKYWKAFVAGLIGLALLAATILNGRKRRAVRKSEKAVNKVNVIHGQRTEVARQTDALDAEFRNLSEENTRLIRTVRQPVEVTDLETQWREELKK